jgi:hypothetical protein
MSKQNKVNPGTYTQAGRLSPDDTAREMKKQREMAASGNPDAKAEPRTPSSRVTDKDKKADEEEPEDSVEE